MYVGNFMNIHVYVSVNNNMSALRFSEQLLLNN